MARGPADGGRGQGQAWGHRPTPQPEMTTVRPSSRILPTWNTDGLRLRLTEPSPRRSRQSGHVQWRLWTSFGGIQQELESQRRNSSEVGGLATSLSRYSA